MWNEFVCRHRQVEWVSSHHCICPACGKHGHFFEEEYTVWTKSRLRPELEENYPSEPLRRAS